MSGGVAYVYDPDGAFTNLVNHAQAEVYAVMGDEAAEDYVPEMRTWSYPTQDSPRIRVRDLLHHTAGFVTDDPWGDRQNPMTEADFTALLHAGVPFSRPPGTAMEYSNLGYALLGRVVASVTGRPFAEVVADTLLRPLGMTASGFEPGDVPADTRALGYRRAAEAWQREPDMPHGAFSPMGGLLTSARDYARWVAFLLDAWPPRDAPDIGPVKRATVREMVQGANFVNLLPGRPGPDGPGPRRAGAYAMGLNAVADPELGLVLSHAGGYPGYGSYMMVLPDKGLGVFAFTNRTYGVPARPVTDAALALLNAGHLTPRATPVSADLAAAYQAVVRVFAQGDISVATEMLAMNMLLDRDAEAWATLLAELKAQAGEFDTGADIVATGALSGHFVWPCSHGRITGHVLLAPTRPPRIQEIRLSHHES
jgi:CubicO group peptidase (beta-lactamase class C family)